MPERSAEIMAAYQRNAGPHADNQGHCSPDDSLVATDPGADNAQTQPGVGLAFNEFDIEEATAFKWYSSTSAVIAVLM